MNGNKYKAFLVWYITPNDDEEGKCIVVYAATARQAKIKFTTLKGHYNHRPYLAHVITVIS